MTTGPAVAFGGGSPAVDTRVYTYSVHHSRHGEIGTYENIVARNGSETVVTNKVNIEVRVLMISAHDHVAERREVWRDGRMVRFEGATRENGKEFHLSGRAEGDRFVIEGPQGQTEAPADVRPSNPWSEEILQASVLMGTKSGSLYQVHASEGEERVVTVAGREVKTTYFKVDGEKQYELWFDEAGVPVRFADLRDREQITFELIGNTQRAEATETLVVR